LTLENSYRAAASPSLLFSLLLYTAAKLTHHFTSFKCQRVWESACKSATYDDTIRELWYNRS